MACRGFGGDNLVKGITWKRRCRWENIVKMYLQDVEWGCMDWNDRKIWREFVKAVMNPHVSVKC